VTFADIAEVATPDGMVVYEHGWQSWSPTGTYAATATSPRPASRDRQVLGFRPEMERREEWAETVERWGGLRASGDRLAALDGWGLETTRRLLVPSSPQPLVGT
jgi:alpha-galactosidase